MALTLDSTLSGEFSNSYVTLDYADEYWEGHYLPASATAWSALSDEAKTTLLILSCRVIEKYKFTNRANNNSAYRLYFDDVRQAIRAFNEGQYEPYKYDINQKLQFPRSIDIAIDGDTFIPEEVKIAQCEQALYVSTFDASVITKSLSGVIEESFGLGRGQIERSTKYGSATGSTVNAMTTLGPIAMELLIPLILKHSKVWRS